MELIRVLHRELGKGVEILATDRRLELSTARLDLLCTVPVRDEISRAGKVTTYLISSLVTTVSRMPAVELVSFCESLTTHTSTSISFQ